MRAFQLLVLLCSVVASARQATAQVLVTSSPLLEREARGGERYEGRIELMNSSSVPQEAKLYQTDYAISADGRVSYGAAGSLPRSNASWITFSTPHVVLPPGGKTSVTYVVTVPAVPSLAGTYWSMIMVEGIDRGSEASNGARANGRPAIAIGSTLRYGIQVATHVGTDGTLRVAFDSVRAANDAEKRVLSYDFVNTGERATRLLMSVELFSADGRPVRKLEQQRGLLYPGNSARQRFDLGALPAGTYTAIITADAGGDEMFGAQYTLRF